MLDDDTMFFHITEKNSKTDTLLVYFSFSKVSCVIPPLGNTTPLFAFLHSPPPIRNNRDLTTEVVESSHYELPTRTLQLRRCEKARNDFFLPFFIFPKSRETRLTLSLRQMGIAFKETTKLCHLIEVDYDFSLSLNQMLTVKRCLFLVKKKTNKKKHAKYKSKASSAIKLFNKLELMLRIRGRGKRELNSRNVMSKRWMLYQTIDESEAFRV